jgi:ribosomal protein S18 acetylase RimI-like enzyme
MIRQCDPTGDRKGLRECIVALQDFERRLEPTLPAGEAMADAYLTFLFDQCARLSGQILVAEDEAGIAGFVCVLTKVLPDEPNDPPEEYAYISDLVVLPQHRGQGAGGNLLARAEALAREAGVGTLHVGVLAKNRAAHDLYRSRGFSDLHIQLVKHL